MKSVLVVFQDPAVSEKEHYHGYSSHAYIHYTSIHTTYMYMYNVHTFDLLVKWLKPVTQNFIIIIGRQRARKAPINSLLTTDPTLQHTSAHTRAKSHSVWLERREGEM